MDAAVVRGNRGIERLCGAVMHGGRLVRPCTVPSFLVKGFCSIRRARAVNVTATSSQPGRYGYLRPLQSA